MSKYERAAPDWIVRLLSLLVLLLLFLEVVVVSKIFNGWLRLCSLFLNSSFLAIKHYSCNMSIILFIAFIFC